MQTEILFYVVKKIGVTARFGYRRTHPTIDIKIKFLTFALS